MTTHGSRIALCLAAATWACSGEAARVPAADTPVAVAVPLPEIPESRFDLPLRYDIASVLAVVERAVPTRFGSLDSVHQAGDDPNRHYSFEAEREPFTSFIDDAGVHLRSTLTYRARFFVKPRIGPTLSAGCGTSTDQPPRIVVEIASPLSLTPNWRLSSRTTLVRVERASDEERDRCQVRLLRVDVTDRVIDAARQALTARLPDIDQKIASVDLSSRAASWWAVLNRPIRITNNVWLLLSPQRLRMGRVTGKGQVLTARIGLDARPRIVTAERRPTVSGVRLPRLARDTVSNGFRIRIEAIVDYSAASQVLNTALRGTSVTEQGHTVTVDSVSVSPGPGGRLELTVAFHGDAQGSLRFVGVPRHDDARNAITMPDLDYDLQTDRAAVNVYSWLRSDALRALFREKAVVPEGAALERGRRLLLAGLNRRIGDAATLTASIDSVAVRGLYVTSWGIVIHAEAAGRAAVSVKDQGAM